MKLTKKHKRCLGYHDLSSDNDKLNKSKTCGCFNCRRIFPSSKINWVKRGVKVATCPFCDVDSVIPEMKGMKKILTEMYEIFFKGMVK